MTVHLNLTYSEAEQTYFAPQEYEKRLKKEYGALPLAQDDQRDVASVMTKINAGTTSTDD